MLRIVSNLHVFGACELGAAPALWLVFGKSALRAMWHDCELTTALYPSLCMTDGVYRANQPRIVILHCSPLQEDSKPRNRAGLSWFNCHFDETERPVAPSQCQRKPRIALFLEVRHPFETLVETNSFVLLYR